MKAFPGFDYISQDGKVNPSGMDLRDYFAGQALAGMMAHKHTGHDGNPTICIVANAYEIADAMMKARKA